MPEAVLEDVLSGLDFDIQCESEHGHHPDLQHEHPAEFITYWSCGCPLFLCSTALMFALNYSAPFYCDDCGSGETVLTRYELIRDAR